MKRTSLIITCTFALLFSCFTFALAAPSKLPQTGQKSCYSTSGAAIDCLDSGQDGEVQSGVSWPEPRFVDNGNGTVTDKLTGLIWLKDANCLRKSWEGAVLASNSLANGQCGLTDGSTAGQWRLPNVSELISLVNEQETHPADWLNTQGFSGVHSEFYWSSSIQGDPLCPRPWHVDLFAGHVYLPDYSGWCDAYSYMSTLRYVLPVRDGAPGDVSISKTGVTLSYMDGDDGSLQKGAAWPTPRFVDNGDETVTDLVTNLVWSQDGNAPGPEVCTPGTTKDWPHALEYVKCLNANAYLGKRDWRLPNKEEMRSLVNYAQSDYGPYSPGEWLNTQGFTNVPGPSYWGSFYWTSNFNTYIGKPKILAMHDGGVGYYQSDYTFMYVWPVRGGHWSLENVNIYGTTNLGRVNAGLVGSSRVLTAHNFGMSAPAAASFAISGSNASDFSLAPGGPLPCSSLAPTLAAGEKCTLKLSFAPNGAGGKNANLTLTVGTASLDLPVTGTAMATISGTVYDLSTGAPLAGAAVTITGGLTDSSDTNGNFEILPEPAPGSYEATVSKAGYSGYKVHDLIITPTYGALANFYVAPVGSLNFVSATLLSGAVTGRSYSAPLKVTGGTAPYAFQTIPGLGSLPPGLTLDSSSGVISGIPTTLGNSTFWVRCTDADASVTEKEFTINASAPLTITSDTVLPEGLTQAGYSASLGVAGGTAPYHFVGSNGTIPPGLTLNGTGLISGKAIIEGEYSFIVTVTDGLGRTAEKTFVITIRPALVISTSRLNDGIVGVATSQPLSSTGNLGATAWSLTEGSLPAGLQLNAVTGVISGTPTAAETRQVTLSVHDAWGRTASKQFTIRTGSVLQFTTSTMPTGYSAVPYHAAAETIGGIGPITYSLKSGILPSGLILNQSTGAISGTPTTSGVLVNFTIAAIDSSYPTPQTAQKALSIRTLTPPNYQVSLSLAGDGSGQVNGDLTCVSGAVCPSGQFPLGTTVRLMPTPSAGSLFAGWSGACDGLGACEVYLDAARSVTATFTAGKPVKVSETARTYSLLQAAYNDAATQSGHNIKAWSVSLKESLILNRPIQITIRGGHDHSYNKINHEETAVQGKLLIRRGRLNADSLVVW